jgi:putative phosphoribosyl transferase
VRVAALEVFADRTAAGKRLAGELVRRGLRKPIAVLGLPRGGVPVAYEVARALGAPLDVLVVRKIGLPGQPEFAIGAIAAGGILVGNPQLIGSGRGGAFEELVRRERQELERRESAYRAGLPPLDIAKRTAVLVDDGLATGSTMLAALKAARQAGASAVVCAAPVGSEEAAALVRAVADDVVLLQIPANLQSVGQWYAHFEQLDDAQVQRLLAQAHAAQSGQPWPPASEP